MEDVGVEEEEEEEAERRGIWKDWMSRRRRDRGEAKDVNA